MDEYCNCHLKHSEIMDQLKKDSRENRDEHETMWEATKQKLSSSWLLALIPVIMAWIGFQLVIYDSVKNVEMKVAVIQTELKAYTEGKR